MRLLVTGGTGFIGTHFIRELSARGWSLTVLDLYPPTPETAGAVTYVRGDVRDPVAVREAMRGCEAVLHLAAAHHDFGLTRETYFSVNEDGTRVLCEVMADCGVHRLCFFSSAAVYGPNGNHDESEQPAPEGPYGQSKLAGEREVERWCAAVDGRSCLIMRPTVVFGSGNHANMRKLIRQIASGVFVQVGDGENRKSMAYVTNLVAATLFLWPSVVSGQAVFNYVDKPDLTSKEIVATICEELGRKPPRLHVPLGIALVLARPFDLLATFLRRPLAISVLGVRKFAAVSSVFASDRLRETGFRPDVSLREGIRAMVRWCAVASEDEAEARLPPALFGSQPDDAAALDRTSA